MSDGQDTMVGHVMLRGTDQIEPASWYKWSNVICNMYIEDIIIHLSVDIDTPRNGYCKSIKSNQVVDGLTRSLSIILQFEPIDESEANV